MNEEEDCDLCGFAVDDETGIFKDNLSEKMVVAHAQCGIDAGLELA